MFHQQTYLTTGGDDELLLDDSTPITFGENKKTNCKMVKTDLPVVSSNGKHACPRRYTTHCELTVLDDKLSTLFNTTGREKNSTGPLKQWLFEHQHHPCSSRGTAFALLPLRSRSQRKRQARSDGKD